jgi:hypothetical protein
MDGTERVLALRAALHGFWTMEPNTVLDYARPGRPIAPGVRAWVSRHRRPVLAIAGLGLFLYATSYAFVRESHTKFWWDKEANQRMPYTLFDAYTRGELCLYVVFWPACAADRAVTDRWFEYDKW